VAVTLDACPGHFDLRVATTLVAQNIKATVNLCATWMHQNPNALAWLQAHPTIFNLQNHGAHHLPAVLGTATVYGLPVAGCLAGIKAEVLDGAAALQAAGLPAPVWYRTAAALYSPQAVPFIQGLGVRIQGYSLNVDDGASLPAAAVSARLQTAQDGEVLIGHINQPHRASGAGWAEGLPRLQAAGTEFVWLTDPGVV
jgi:peptidoglycan/xylan/chitin deacetylase (PgdA/CDA1 family)